MQTATWTTTETQLEEPPRTVIQFRLQPRRGIQWEETVIDNENMGKRSSKSPCSRCRARAALPACRAVLHAHRPAFASHNLTAVCCIFHKPKGFGESDSESDSDHDSASGSGSDGYDSDVEWRRRMRQPPPSAARSGAAEAQPAPQAAEVGSK